MFLLFGIVGLVILLIISFLLRLSLKIIRKLLINGILGVLLLTLTNIAVSVLNLGVRFEIEPISAVLAGIFGLPYIAIRLILALM